MRPHLHLHMAFWQRAPSQQSHLQSQLRATFLQAAAPAEGALQASWVDTALANSALVVRRGRCTPSVLVNASNDRASMDGLPFPESHHNLGFEHRERRPEVRRRCLALADLSLAGLPGLLAGFAPAGPNQRWEANEQLGAATRRLPTAPIPQKFPKFAAPKQIP